MFYQRKKIIFLIVSLFVLNLFFLFDVFYKDGAIAQESYCYSRDKIFYYPESLVISESRTCDSNCNAENNGKVLFKYYGEDSDCSSAYKQGTLGQQKCKEEFPFGGPGTFQTGGNLVVNNTKGFYFNGRDNSGFFWILSGTEQEPQGRAMGFRTGLEDVYFGGSIVVGNDLNLKGRINFVDENYIARERKTRISKGAPDFFNEISLNDNIHLLEGNGIDNPDIGEDVGICGERREVKDSNGDYTWECLYGGDNYRTILDEKTIIKGNFKVEDDLYIFWPFNGSINIAKVLYYKQTVRHYYRQIEERKEEFAGKSACCSETVTERQAYGIYYGGAPVKRCWPQPLNHYKIVNYHYDGNSVVGEVVPCKTDGGCQSCKSSNLVAYPSAQTFGCPE